MDHGLSLGETEHEIGFPDRSGPIHRIDPAIWFLNWRIDVPMTHVSDGPKYLDLGFLILRNRVSPQEHDLKTICELDP